MDSGSNLKIAVLIDADNISSDYVKQIFEKISTYGSATYRRAYGNWTSPNLQPWKGVLQEYSLTPMQQFSNTSGKNSTDSALIIDAMDIYYSKTVDGFAIVSSDSDFTRLASNLREKGMFVIGMGEAKTPKPMRTACQEFIELKEHVGPKEVLATQTKGKQPSKSNPEDQEKADIVRRLEEMIESSDGDRMRLSDVGTVFARTVPPVEWTKFGHKKLAGLVEGLGFEVSIEGENVLWVAMKGKQAQTPKKAKK